MRDLPHTKVPCKDCLFREPGCHGKCDQYRDFRRVVDQIRNHEALVTYGARDAYYYKKSVIERIEKRKHGMQKG